MALKKAIGLVELNSIARGFLTCDTMVKTAQVELIETLTICPGKYMILVGGEVGAVKSSVEAGVLRGGEAVVDHLLIPNVHPDIFPAINASTQVDEIDALGIFETFTVASGIIAADAAVKTAAVRLIELRLAKGIGGKSFFTLTGQVSAVQAAIQAGKELIEKEGVFVGSQIIPRPDPALIKMIW
ncbi:BMC domain-containing protein [Anoxybacter fermentans]|uniref:BMC domain-containing protein n=1 Tax=Anoxybacter fermentans TaxID=1323375 RepID=UPI00196AAAF4|nr:BMC domain-containing protein [Anoxybacter fermentans]